MTHPVDILLVLVILLNFLVLGTPALRMTIRAAAAQGAILALSRSSSTAASAGASSRSPSRRWP